MQLSVEYDTFHLTPFKQSPNVDCLYRADYDKRPFADDDANGIASFLAGCIISTIDTVQSDFPNHPAFVATITISSADGIEYDTFNVLRDDSHVTVIMRDQCKQFIAVDACEASATERDIGAFIEASLRLFQYCAGDDIPDDE